MGLMQYLPHNAKIAIYDDQDDSRESFVDNVCEAGYVPEPIEEPLFTIDECVNRLLNFDGVLIDHRLSPGNFGDYTGAEVVRRLYSLKKPALLITAWAYGDPEALQPFNKYLVNVVKKGEDDEIEQIQTGFKTYVDEMNNIFAPERKPTRTIIVVASDFEANEGLNRVEAFLPSWNPKEGITFPIDVVPEEFRPRLKKDQCFLVNANTGAQSQHELFFENFGLAPNPDE